MEARRPAGLRERLNAPTAKIRHPPAPGAAEALQLLVNDDGCSERDFLHQVPEVIGGCAKAAGGECVAELA